MSASMFRLLPFLFVVAGLVIGAIAMPGVIETLSIAADVDGFETTTAKVVSKSERKHQRGPATYELKYEFRLGERTWSGDNRHSRFADDEENVRARVRRVDGTDTITVYYDPENPRRSTITREIDVWRPSAIAVFAFLAVFGGVQAFRVDRKRRRLMQSRSSTTRERTPKPETTGSGTALSEEE